MTDAAAVNSPRTASLIVGNEDDLDELDPLICYSQMKTWRTTKLS